MPTRLLPPLLIALLGLLFFAELVVYPTQVLYSDYSDLLAFHLPSKWFLVRSWQETGELPLWCPYSFSGMPFLHDIQVSAFYPPHGPLFLLREEWLGAALSWLIVGHVIVAGWTMYAYARSQELGPAAALVAAFGYMFAGKWLLHVLAAGHYNMLPLAWLPLVLLGLEQAVRRHSLLCATWAGAAYSLVILAAYPYVTFYAGLFVGLWTLGPALEQAGYLGGDGPRSRRRTLLALARWAGLGAWTAVVAVALGLVQLWPSLEAAGQASRAGGVPATDVLQGGLRALLWLVGPALSTTPSHLMWDDRGGFGVLWLVAAACAPLLGSKRVRFQTGVCLALFLFALGGAAAFQWLPGFRLFRFPSRMLMIAALPVALLAGATTQALFAAPPPTPEAIRRCRKTLLQIVATSLLLVGGFAIRLWREGKDMHLPLYWAVAPLTILIALGLLGGRWQLASRRGVILWTGILLADVWTLGWPLVEVRPEADIYPPSACVLAVAGKEEEHGRVLDQNVSDEADTPLGTGAPLALLWRLEAVRGFNPVDVLRYKEYLEMIEDEDRPLVPLEDPLTFPVIPSPRIENRSLLDVLGVRYLLQPSDRPLPGKGWRKLDGDDPHPVAFNFNVGGLRELPPYSVYINDQCYPRAFVAPEAAPLPERSQVLAALKATDFRRQVLLEGFTPRSESATPQGGFRPVAIRKYQPNEIVIDLEGGPAGYLVLADVWFPGWTCTVDGNTTPIHRADYLFRAVEVPAGAHEAVFTFAPASYRWGKLVSGAAFAVVLGWSVLVLGARRWCRSA